MNDRLFPFLLALTLLDLAFVQATGATALGAMLPMWLLALAAPWLRRLQRSWSYRAFWNTIVLVVFTLLVHHATTTGLLHMLEDGLVLAVLCQVHLLNNVGERQRPDLVFFNSFLVAFVTSFFAPDLTWSLLFVLHALVLVPSLAVNTFVRAGRPLPAPLLRRLLLDGTRRTAWIGGLTMVVFVAWPRDFRREGWLQAALMQPAAGEAGLAERVRLGDERPMLESDAEVARIEVPPAAAASLPPHWRTHAFVFFDGTAWEQHTPGSPGTPSPLDPTWQPRTDGRWQRGPAPSDLGATPLRALVRLQATGSDSIRLPLPVAVQAIDLLAPADTPPTPTAHGGLMVPLAADDLRSAVRYEVTFGATAAAAIPSAAWLRSLLDLPSRVPSTAQKLAQQLRSEVPTNAEPLTIAAHCAAWLQQNRRYQLPGEGAFAKNLGEFLLGSAAGHCEYFATTLALLLRLQRVPCRLAGGYLVQQLEGDAAFVVRARDAHAWVEVWSDGRWHTVDATPATAPRAAAAESEGFFGGLQSLLRDAWQAIAGFDDQRREQWLGALLGLPRQHPLALLALLALLAVAWQHRRRQALPAIRTLQRAVRRSGLPFVHGETPRELLRRAEGTALRAPALLQLRAAVEAHERARYAAPRSERT
jgi:protein-glutamine gamma-glutamyltransferase